MKRLLIIALFLALIPFTGVAQSHDVPDGYFSVWDYGAIPDDGGDDSAAFQAAIDAAHRPDNLSVGVVWIPPGEYNWAEPVEWKNAHIVGVFPNNSVRIYWDGPTDVAALTKTQNQFGELSGINFRGGKNIPAVWVDLTTTSVDKYLYLHHLHFGAATTAAIRTAGWVNLHWDHLRWDIVGAGGWAIQLIPHAGQNLASFVLENSTYDHNSAVPAEGFIQVDNSANNSHLGAFRISGGRWEINQPWTGAKALVSLKLPTVANPRSLGLHFSDIAVQISNGGGVVLYRDTANTTGSETLKLTNFHSSGLTEILGGSWPASFPRPAAGHYMDLSLGQDSLVHVPGFARHPAATTPGSVTNKIEVFDEAGASLGFLPVYDEIK